MQLNLSRRFGDIKIGTRLALSYAVILVLMMMALTFIAYNIKAANQHSATIVQEDIVKLRLLADVNDSVAVVTRVMRSIMLLRNDPARAAIEKNKLDAARQKYGEANKQLQALPHDEFGHNILPKMADELQKARELDDMVLALHEKGKPEEALDLLMNKAIPAIDKWKITIDEYTEHQKQKADEARAEIERHANSTFAISAALSVLVLLLTAVSAFVITRSITRPLNALQKAINDVRQGGDLGALAQIDSKDEFADMGFAVNQVLQEQISAREKEFFAREKADEERRKAEAENESLNNSVIALLQTVNSLSQRDLTARAPLSGDIIDTVSDSINQLTDETSKVLHDVNLMANQMEQVSGSVHKQSELVAITAKEERENVIEMVQSLGESAENMGLIADMAEQSNRSAERATQATNTALATVNSTVKGMESIRETIAETEKRIKRLGDRSQEISGIVNLINTISERTHVLALNASMQAAVAGEAGRGFAVVAEEVQRLAESSRNATQQIGTLVSNIQLETNETISTVNRTIGQVVHGSEQAQKAGEQMRITQEITSELVEQVRIIAEAQEQQKEMSILMLESVQRLGQSNERTSQQIGTQGEETLALSESARQLVDSVSVFKLPKFA